MKTGQVITVGVIFGGKRKIRPVWFIWQGREYHIKHITYVWNRREGNSLLYLFSVIDTADNLHELCYQTDSALWSLLTTEEATART